jgi:alpha-L-fucosidase
MNRTVLFLVVISTLLLLSCASKPEQAPKAADRLQWWDEARFAMFIHWGVYAVPAGVYQGKSDEFNQGEWIMNHSKIPVAEYKKFATEFNPVKYDPEAWVKLAKDAGMKYIVITSKHHDGFALFDSKVTDWDVVDATPYGKDLLAPLVAACRREGIKIGFYYSQSQDWCHPGGAAADWVHSPTLKWTGSWDKAQFGDYDKYLDEIAVPQVKEILTRYGDIDILWWDTPMHMTPERIAKFQNVVSDYPNLITNNRLARDVKGDTETPEQHIPATGYPGRRFEVCMTMNETWGYRSDDHNWKSAEELILTLSDISSKGGNFLLNVGPTAEGLIPQPSIDRLLKVGAWMKVNSEAVYGTKASPFHFLPWGKATMKDQKLYLHVVEWPENGMLGLPLRNTALKAYPLKNQKSGLKIKQYANKIEIMVGEKDPDDFLPIIVLEFKGEASVLPIPTAGKIPKTSSVDTSAQVTALFDNDPKSKWMAAPGEKTAWIEIDLEDETGIFNLSMIEPWHPWENKMQKYTLQYKKGDQWIDIVNGETGGSGHSKSFEPIIGRYFRLLLTGAEGEVPVLNELILNRAF